MQTDRERIMEHLQSSVLDSYIRFEIRQTTTNDPHSSTTLLDDLLNSFRHVLVGDDATMTDDWLQLCEHQVVGLWNGLLAASRIGLSPMQSVMFVNDLTFMFAEGKLMEQSLKQREPHTESS